MVKLLYILGSGHCGSTVFNQLLNNHPDLVGLSEIFIIRRYHEKRWDKLFKNQPYWQDVNAEFLKRTSKSLLETKFPEARWRDVINDNRNLVREFQKYWQLYDCVRDLTEKVSVVDSSKNLTHLYFLKKAMRPQDDLKVIHLIRDGRAVINSYIRRYNNFRLGCHRWLKTNVGSELIKTQFAQDKWLTIKYEDLTKYPEKSLEVVCQFIGIEYTEAMLKFQPTKLAIAGNNMPYRRANREQIKFDERWKQELKQEDLVQFNLLGGWLNRYYGY